MFLQKRLIRSGRDGRKSSSYKSRRWPQKIHTMNAVRTRSVTLKYFLLFTVSTQFMYLATINVLWACVWAPHLNTPERATARLIRNMRHLRCPITCHITQRYLIFGAGTQLLHLTTLGIYSHPPDYQSSHEHNSDRTASASVWATTRFIFVAMPDYLIISPKMLPQGSSVTFESSSFFCATHTT